jgi:chaperonin GroEL
MDKVGKEGVITVEDGNPRVRATWLKVCSLTAATCHLTSSTTLKKRSAILDNPFVLSFTTKINIRRPAPDAGTSHWLAVLCSSSLKLMAKPWQRWWSTHPAGIFESGGRQGSRLRRSPQKPWEDIACLTGGKVIAEEVGMSLEK